MYLLRMVLLPHRDLEGAGHFAEKLRRRIAEHRFDVDGCQTRLTVSIGVAEWPSHGDTLEAVIEKANREERRAKEGGKNCVHIATA